VLKILAVAALLLGAPAAYSQTVSSCPTATPGTVWSKGEWLPCSTTVVYIAQPVPATAPVSDMRCPIAPATGVCVFSWQLGPKVLPTDQVWVETTAKPKGIWDAASRLKFASAPLLGCTTLFYQGAPFVPLTTTGPNATVIVPPVGTITLAEPLPANAVNLAVTPVAWDFSSESPNLTSTSPLNTTDSGPGTPFSFSTDANGNIIGWHFFVAFAGGQPWQNFGLNSSNTSGNYGTTADYVGSSTYVAGAPSNTASINGNSATPGTWSCKAPPICLEVIE
jgi:hypothetical protein